jgi:hypothetical protein
VHSILDEIDAEEFESLCEELLLAKGFTIQSRPARGPDQGKDMLATRDVTDDMGIVIREVWLVECKHFGASGASVREKDIGNFEARMKLHRANRYLLVSSTTVSETVRNQLDAVSQDESSARRATFWTRQDLLRLLGENPEVGRRYAPHQQAAEKIVELIRNDHKLLSVHRGAMAWGNDATVVYGNDGYRPIDESAPDPKNVRTHRQIALLRLMLKDKGWQEIAFAASPDGVTWVLLVRSTEVDTLKQILWACFMKALEEQTGGEPV